MSIESKVSSLSKKDIAIIAAAVVAISAPVAVLAARETPTYRRRKEGQRLVREEHERIGEILEDNINSGNSGIEFTKEGVKQ